MNIDEYRDGFRIRSIRPIDKDLFMELRKSISIIGEAYNEVPEFLESDWIRLLESTEDHHMVVYDNNDSRFIATCSFQDIFDNDTGKEIDTNELGLNVIDDLRGQGIGTRIMHELIDLGHKHFPDRELNVCVRKDNIPSIRVAEKCILRRRTDTGAFAGGHSAALADIDFFCLSGYFSFNNDIVVLRYPFKHGVG